MAFEISGRFVGPGQPTYIVAEMSANHAHRLEHAEQVLRAAHAAGADAVKLQTYRADTITIDCDNEYFRVKGTLWKGRNLYNLYEEAATPWEWHEPLKRLADELGLGFFSTPFDDSAVDFLETLGVPAYKIASFEIVDIPLLRRVARTGKPIILSTGMATRAEIEEAVREVRSHEGGPVALLKCTSSYPAAPETMNLRTIPELAATYDVPVGLSDHSMSAAVPVAAVALGACIIEKHLTTDRSMGGPDSEFSLEPAEFREMVDAIRIAERALGSVTFGGSTEESSSRVFRRSLFIVSDIRAGERFTSGNVRSIRPGHGLHTRHYDDVLGRKAAADIRRGTPLSWDLVSGGPAKPGSESAG